jgi:prevent-host-death family protein
MKSPNEIPMSRFKSHALEILREVERTGQPVVITDRGRRALEVRKYVARSPSALERLRGSVLRYDDPLTPVAEDDWDVLG